MAGTRIVVAGGGAAGFFGAVTCAQNHPDAGVILLEKSPELLAKVTISGGGRCNVTHACFDPDRLVERYPRGARELIGPFHRWQPRDTVEWFEARGVKIKTEDDGRMFPTTDKSSTIVDCLVREARGAGVDIRLRAGVTKAERRTGGGFRLHLSGGELLECDRILLATGGNQNSNGFAVAAGLGHEIQPLVPSLFTFNIKDARLAGLPGISVPEAEVSVPSDRLRQRGPLLITHWGLSGPAILKLSAWGARALADRDYTFDLDVNWMPSIARPALIALLEAIRRDQPGKMLVNTPQGGLPARLWRSLVIGAGLAEESRWSTLSNAGLQRLAQELNAGRFRVEGKSLFKDEFVTCGGVNLREVDFRTMQSRICPGLHFAGEVLDLDGVTGGFNLQAAWTTGWIAGQSLAAG